MNKKRFVDEYRLEITEDVTREYDLEVNNGNLEFVKGKEVEGRLIKVYDVRVIKRKDDEVSYVFRVTDPDEILYEIEQEFELNKELNARKEFVLINAIAERYIPDDFFAEDIIITKKTYNKAKSYVNNFEFCTGKVEGVFADKKAIIRIKEVSEKRLSDITIIEEDWLMKEVFMEGLMKAGVSAKEIREDQEKVERMLKKIEKHGKIF